MYHIKVAIWVAVCVWLLTGCTMIRETFFARDNTPPAAPLVDFAPTLSVQSLWRVRSGRGTNGDYIRLRPAVTGDRVITADVRGTVTAHNRMTGRRIWTVNVGEPISSGPSVDEEIVALGTKSAQVITLEQASGTPWWLVAVNNQVLGAPIITDELVLVKSVDDQLAAFDRYDGQKIWQHDTDSPDLILHAGSAPVAVDNRVVAGFADGSLAVFDMHTGELLWERQIAEPQGASEIERMVDIDADPIVSNGIIYVTTYQGNLVALSLAEGEVLWEQPLSSYTGLALSEDAVFVSDADSFLWAFDRTTGHILWVEQQLRNRQITAPVLLNDILIVGDGEGYLHWISAQSGQFLARNSVSRNAILAAPMADDGDVYVLTEDGILEAFRVSSLAE